MPGVVRRRRRSRAPAGSPRADPPPRRWSPGRARRPGRRAPSTASPSPSRRPISRHLAAWRPWRRGARAAPARRRPDRSASGRRTTWAGRPRAAAARPAPTSADEIACAAADDSTATVRPAWCSSVTAWARAASMDPSLSTACSSSNAGRSSPRIVRRPTSVRLPSGAPRPALPRPADRGRADQSLDFRVRPAGRYPGNRVPAEAVGRCSPASAGRGSTPGTTRARRRRGCAALARCWCTTPADRSPSRRPGPAGAVFPAATAGPRADRPTLGRAPRRRTRVWCGWPSAWSPALRSRPCRGCGWWRRPPGAQRLHQRDWRAWLSTGPPRGGTGRDGGSTSRLIGVPGQRRFVTAPGPRLGVGFGGFQRLHHQVHGQRRRRQRGRFRRHRSPPSARCRSRAGRCGPRAGGAARADSPRPPRPPGRRRAGAASAAPGRPARCPARPRSRRRPRRWSPAPHRRPAGSPPARWRRFFALRRNAFRPCRHAAQVAQRGLLAADADDHARQRAVQAAPT